MPIKRRQSVKQTKHPSSRRVASRVVIGKRRRLFLELSEVRHGLLVHDICAQRVNGQDQHTKIGTLAISQWIEWVVKTAHMAVKT